MTGIRSTFSGPLYVQLLGSEAQTSEILLARGSAGYQMPAYGNCTPGELYTEFFHLHKAGGASYPSICQPLVKASSGGTSKTIVFGATPAQIPNVVLSSSQVAVDPLLL